MFCCTCAGSCNHVGNHSFCAAHGGAIYTYPWTGSTTTIIPPWPEHGKRSYIGKHRKGDPEDGA